MPAPGPKKKILNTAENLLKVLKNLLGKNEGGKFGKFARRICSEQIFEQKKIVWAIFRQAIEGSKLAQKFAKFPPHLPYLYEGTLV